MLLSRKAKLVWIGTIATAAIVAITLGITLSPSSRSNEIAQGTSGSAGSIDDTTTGDVCPCFNGDDFDSAVTDITSGDPAFAFASTSSCTGEDSDGIKYSRDGHLLGFSVEKGYLMCTNMDMVHSIAQDEATACATLIVDKCAEHKDDLDAVAVVAPDVLAPKISCPCFAASSLDSVITAVLDGSLTLNADSCAETENGRTISYTVQEYYEYHSWGVGTFGSELSCQHADTIRPGISDEEYNACKTIVDDGCTKLEM